MARVVRYEPCPRCRSVNRDSRGDNLVVYDDGGAHCFSCSYHVHSKPSLFLPKPIKYEQKDTLPRDFTREVPATAWKWLLQFGLPWSYWKESCGYSPHDERLVFLVGEGPRFSIGRFVGDATKYERKPRKWFVWGDSHKHCEVLGDGKSVILVEDLVSAHKVAQVTTAIPLFGTEFHPCHLYYLMNQDKPIKIWLDKDQEGNVHKKALRLSGLVDNPVDIIVTENDPKQLSINDIKELV